MTFHDLTLATALTTAAALAAPAAFAQGSDNPNTGTVANVVSRANAEIQETLNDINVESVSPSDLDLMGKDVTDADQTLVKNILAEAENGAALSSVDDNVIGEVTGTMGEQGSDSLVYVDVSQEAGLAADRLAFRASALSVEEDGDLEYAMTLEDLRKNVAERVATQRM
ncbi:MAG: phosphoribosylglycinamide synthetase [Roseovarius sp.]|uniref:phosphoribosylglycinamide synthetase n=1 Tax=Roseovarius sp. TaxID=1486281 RepID=UPI0040597BC7